MTVMRAWKTRPRRSPRNGNERQPPHPRQDGLLLEQAHASAKPQTRQISSRAGQRFPSINGKGPEVDMLAGDAPKFLQKYLASHEASDNRYLGGSARSILHPNLWHVTGDRSRAGGGGHVRGARAGSNPGAVARRGVLAVAFRVNLPVAVAVTLYTNPITIGPLYVIAYWIGTLLVPRRQRALHHPPGFDWSNLGAWLRALFEWALSLGKPLPWPGVLAVGPRIAGYVIVHLAWRAHRGLAWRRRKRDARKQIG